MSTGIIALLIAILGAVLLALKGWRDHRDAMVSRAGLLDPVRQLFEAPQIAIGPDGFPALSGHLADGRRMRLALIADSLVPRRLPQLWLDLTILDLGSRRGYSIGLWPVRPGRNSIPWFMSCRRFSLRLPANCR